MAKEMSWNKSFEIRFPLKCYLVLLLLLRMKNDIVFSMALMINILIFAVTLKVDYNQLSSLYVFHSNCREKLFCEYLQGKQFPK